MQKPGPGPNGGGRPEGGDLFQASARHERGRPRSGGGQTGGSHTEHHDEAEGGKGGVSEFDGCSVRGFLMVVGLEGGV